MSVDLTVTWGCLILTLFALFNRLVGSLQGRSWLDFMWRTPIELTPFLGVFLFIFTKLVSHSLNRVLQWVVTDRAEVNPPSARSVSVVALVPSYREPVSLVCKTKVPFNL